MLKNGAWIDFSYVFTKTSLPIPPTEIMVVLAFVIHIFFFSNWVGYYFCLSVLMIPKMNCAIKDSIFRMHQKQSIPKSIRAYCYFVFRKSFKFSFVRYKFTSVRVLHSRIKFAWELNVQYQSRFLEYISRQLGMAYSFYLIVRLFFIRRNPIANNVKLIIMFSQDLSTYPPNPQKPLSL